MMQFLRTYYNRLDCDKLDMANLQFVKKEPISVCYPDSNNYPKITHIPDQKFETIWQWADEWCK